MAKDWHAAATEAGNAVHSVNPSLLVIVGGLSYGKDLTGVFRRHLRPKTEVEVENTLMFNGLPFMNRRFWSFYMRFRGGKSGFHVVERLPVKLKQPDKLAGGSVRALGLDLKEYCGGLQRPLLQLVLSWLAGHLSGGLIKLLNRCAGRRYMISLGRIGASSWRRTSGFLSIFSFCVLVGAFKCSPVGFPVFWIKISGPEVIKSKEESPRMASRLSQVLHRARVGQRVWHL